LNERQSTILSLQSTEGELRAEIHSLQAGEEKMSNGRDQDMSRQLKEKEALYEQAKHHELLLKQQIHELESKVTELSTEQQRQRDKQEAAIEKQENLLHDMDVKYKQALENQEGFKRRIHELMQHQQQQTLPVEPDKTSASFQQQQQQLQDLQQNNKQLELTLQDRQNELQQLREQCNDLQEQLNGQVKYSKCIDEKYTHVQKQLKDANQRYDTLQREKHAVDKQIAQQESSVKSLRSDNGRYKEQVEELEKQLKQRASKMLELQEELQRLNLEKKQHDIQLAELRKQLHQQQLKHTQEISDILERLNGNSNNQPLANNNIDKEQNVNENENGDANHAAESSSRNAGNTFQTPISNNNRVDKNKSASNTATAARASNNKKTAIVETENDSPSQQHITLHIAAISHNAHTTTSVVPNNSNAQPRNPHQPLHLLRSPPTTSSILTATHSQSHPQLRSQLPTSSPMSSGKWMELETMESNAKIRSLLYDSSDDESYETGNNVHARIQRSQKLQQEFQTLFTKLASTSAPTSSNTNLDRQSKRSGKQHQKQPRIRSALASHIADSSDSDNDNDNDVLNILQSRRGKKTAAANAYPFLTHVVRSAASRPATAAAATHSHSHTYSSTYPHSHGHADGHARTHTQKHATKRSKSLSSGEKEQSSRPESSKRNLRLCQTVKVSKVMKESNREPIQASQLFHRG